MLEMKTENDASKRLAIMLCLLTKIFKCVIFPMLQSNILQSESCLVEIYVPWYEAQLYIVLSLSDHIAIYACIRSILVYFYFFILIMYFCTTVFLI